MSFDFSGFASIALVADAARRRAELDAARARVDARTAPLVLDHAKIAAIVAENKEVSAILSSVFDAPTSPPSVASAASASPWPVFAGVSIQSAPAKSAAVAPVSITVRRPDGMVATATPTPETRPLVMGRIGASHPIPVADASFDVESFEVIDADGGRPFVVTPQGVSRKPRKVRAPKAGYRGPKVMQSRYDGFCWGCRERFDAGAWVAYDGNAKRCTGCSDCDVEVFEAQKCARPAKQA